MFKLPKVRKFDYDGVARIVIERGPDKRPGAGLLCLEVKKNGERSNKVKTFKPAKMMNSRRAGKLETLCILVQSVRVG
jgi:hypothetical protein